MSEKPTIRFRKGDLIEMSESQRARLAAMTDDQVLEAALDDPDAQPLSEEQLARMRSARAVRSARQATGLSQAVFAKTFRFTIGRLRDLEQGRTQPDAATLAYVAIIRRDPEAVKRLLA